MSVGRGGWRRPFHAEGQAHGAYSVQLQPPGELRAGRPADDPTRCRHKASETRGQWRQRQSASLRESWLRTFLENLMTVEPIVEPVTEPDSEGDDEEGARTNPTVTLPMQTLAFKPTSRSGIRSTPKSTPKPHGRISTKPRTPRSTQRPISRLSRAASRPRSRNSMWMSARRQRN